MGKLDHFSLDCLASQLSAGWFWKSIMSLSTLSTHQTDITVVLLVFCNRVEQQGLLTEFKITAAKLCEHLKPILLEKLTNAGIALKAATASIIENAGRLIFTVCSSPVFWVLLVAAAGVGAQCELERRGRKDAGRAAGATGTAIAGGLAAFFMAPAALPVLAGAAAGFGVWSAVDKLRSMWTEEKGIVLRINGKEYPIFMCGKFVSQ